MTLYRFETRERTNRVWNAPPAELTTEQIDRLVARGRRLRSEAIVGGLARWFVALRRWLARQPRPAGGVGAPSGARP